MWKFKKCTRVAYHAEKYSQNLLILRNARCFARLRVVLNCISRVGGAFAWRQSETATRTPAPCMYQRVNARIAWSLWLRQKRSFFRFWHSQPSVFCIFIWRCIFERVRWRWWIWKSWALPVWAWRQWRREQCCRFWWYWWRGWWFKKKTAQQH